MIPHKVFTLLCYPYPIGITFYTLLIGVLPLFLICFYSFLVDAFSILYLYLFEKFENSSDEAIIDIIRQIPDLNL
jgi:hypothetical protein